MLKILSPFPPFRPEALKANELRIAQGDNGAAKFLLMIATGSKRARNKTGAGSLGEGVCVCVCSGTKN